MPKRKRVPKEQLSAIDIQTAIQDDEDGNPIVGENDTFVRPDGVEVHERVNLVTKMLRVQQVAAWLLDGAATKDVVVKSKDKWNVCERTAKRYVSVARDQIEAVSAQEIRSAATLSLYRLTELYFAAVQSGDLKTALDVVKAQNRMLGLNAPEKFETKNITDWNSWSVAEQLNHVANILEKANVNRKVN